MADRSAASFLLIEELFAAGDPRFLPTLRTYHDPTPFPAFAQRWLRDSRPWAREQLLTYLDQPLNVPNHNSLVKRLFKGAEAAGDDEVMGAFAVAFDRLVRRKRGRYGFLRSPTNVLHPFPDSWTVNRQDRELIDEHGERLFTYHTRYYLRRRAWRYFRRIGHQQPARYVPGVIAFLARYRDEDLANGVNVLDSWSLMHVCFGESPSVSFLTHRAVLAMDANFARLEAAPDFSDLWKDVRTARSLLSLIGAARSQLVRVFATQLLRRWHLASLRGLSIAEIAPLLLHADEQVQALGVELLESAAGLNAVQFEQWLLLLQAKGLATLQAIADAMRRNVDPASLSLFDAVRLTCAQSAPVARLGLWFLQQQRIESPQQRQALTNLADAKSATAGRDISTWALGILGRKENYDVQQMIRFFDSLLLEIREGARDRLTPQSPGWDDPALWSRLIESPYEDLKLDLIGLLEQRAAHVVSPADLAPLWTAVLLNIHRGGRKKLTALRQISAAVRDHPDAAERLLPVLAVAIRSVRAPEARAGLSAIVTAVATRPELQRVIERELPEMRITAEAV